MTIDIWCVLLFPLHVPQVDVSRTRAPGDEIRSDSDGGV